MRAGLALSLIALVLPLAGAHADPLADFYRGRNVTLIIGYSAGGGYDTYARVVARHLGRHIPGMQLECLRPKKGYRTHGLYREASQRFINGRDW